MLPRPLLHLQIPLVVSLRRLDALVPHDELQSIGWTAAVYVPLRDAVPYFVRVDVYSDSRSRRLDALIGVASVMEGLRKKQSLICRG